MMVAMSRHSNLGVMLIYPFQLHSLAFQCGWHTSRGGIIGQFISMLGAEKTARRCSLIAAV